MIGTEARRKTEADAKPVKRLDESESASSDLTPEEQMEKPGKLTKMQLDKIAEYKRMGGSYREIAGYMALHPSTVYNYWKTFPGPLVPKDSPGPTKLGEAPVVPLEDQKPDNATKIVVNQQVATTGAEQNGSQTQTTLNQTQTAGNSPGTRVEGGYADQNIDLKMQQITIKWDPHLILDLQAAMLGSGETDVSKWWNNYALPRLMAIKEAEDYIDFPTEGNVRDRTRTWVRYFQRQMDFSLKWQQAVDEANKEMVKRAVTRGAN